jgi:AmmeMemoRadiSam system protein B
MAFRHWYPNDCAESIERFVARFEAPADAPLRHAVVAPHAGWRFSGGVAARSLAALAKSRPETVVCFSAIHRAWLDRAAVWTDGSWTTPFGELLVDDELGRQIIARSSGIAYADKTPHLDEHALEVLMPFLHSLVPGARVVPIMVPADDNAVELGKCVASVSQGKRVAALASTDLTHYGETFGFTPAGTGDKAHEWMRANDRRVLELTTSLDAEAIVSEAEEHRNSCGSGALAATVSFARELGSTDGIVLERTDSHEVSGRGTEFSMAVGYAGVML